MKRGSLIIYDNSGKIWINTGDAEGDILPHTLPTGLPYILTEFGELDGKIVKGVDVETKELILEDIPKVETKEEKLNKELLESKSTIVDLQYKELLNKKEEKVGR
ncbi:hypothetical protein [Clostridium botulinum]|uniref:hypothetical protein n=1 Tax=Clostridium botulinum TaxID=1491 RepID=UPI00057D8FE1|nr:hypothetical protein [Clostridium botulinum]